MKENKPEHIDEHLLLQYLHGNLHDHERKVIEEWLQHNEENRKWLEQMEVLWMETGKISPAPVAVDTDAAWEKLYGKINREEEKTGKNGSPGKSRSLHLTYLVAGLAATLLLIAGFYFLFRENSPSGKVIIIASNNRITPDTLDDGSVITLNKRSQIIYPEKFNRKNREVSLTGEATCKIVHDPDWPFILDCGSAKIRVIGTSFHVRAYPGQAVTVIVKEGMVLFFTLDSITGDTNGIRLGPGMKGVLMPGSSVPEKMNNASQDNLPGYEETLHYKETSLRTVLSDLTRIFGTEIQVSDSSIYNCRLTVSFTGEPVDQILKVIAATFDLKLTKNEESYLLTGHGCREKAK